MKETPTSDEADPLHGLSPEQIAVLQEEVGKVVEKQERTSSGSLAPSAGDLDNYEVPPEHEWLYRKARLESVNGHECWVVDETQVLIVNDEWTSKTSSKPNGFNYLIGRPEIDSRGEPKGLPAKLTALLNDRAGWELRGVMPSGAMGSVAPAVAILERKVRRILPDLKPLETEAAVVKVEDEELRRMGESAREWEGAPEGADAEDRDV